MRRFYSLIKLSGRFIQLFISDKFVRPDDFSQSYNDISATYDRLFLHQMGRHSLTLLKNLKVPISPKVLDLGSGTGFAILYFKKKYPKSQIIAIDFSEKMIKVARKSVARENFGNVRLVYGDMLKEIKKLPANTYNPVVCLWALGYTQPKKLLKEIHRVSKTKGTIGIIVNRKNTLPEVRKLFWKALLKYPYKMRKIMIELPLPRNQRHLSNLLRWAGFRNIKTWQNEKQFSFKSGEHATHWVFNTGALAGYDHVLDVRNDPELFEYFANNWETNSQGNIIITHKFVGAMAKK